MQLKPLIRLELTMQVKKMANASRNHFGELTQMSEVTEMTQQILLRTHTQPLET